MLNVNIMDLRLYTLLCVDFYYGHSHLDSVLIYIISIQIILICLPRCVHFKTQWVI